MGASRWWSLPNRPCQRRPRRTYPTLWALEDRALLSVTITDLGNLAPIDLNNNGAVLGTDPTDGPVIDSGGTMTPLPTSFNAEYIALNDQNQAIGTYSITDTFAMVWTGGSNFTALSPNDVKPYVPYVGLFYGGSDAVAINNHGDVLGVSTGDTIDQNFNSTGSHNYATLWPAGQQNPTFLLSIPETSSVTDVNDSGQVVGAYTDTGGNERAFINTGGQFVTLPGLAGDAANPTSNAVAINARGDVIGTDNGQGVLWQLDKQGNYSALSLGSFIPDAINSTGVILGTAQSQSAIWTSTGGVQSLQSLVPSDLGWSNLTALDINDNNQVLGSGSHNGQPSTTILVSGLTFSSPDIAVTSLAWDSKNGGVNFTFQVTGGDLPKDGTVALYWANGPNESDIPPGAQSIAPQTIREAKTYPTVHVTGKQLGEPPKDATYLLAVADHDQQIAESDESNNVKSLLDVQITQVAPVSDYSIMVIKDVMRAAGQANASISSTIRTPKSQAAAMFNNILRTSVQTQKNLYAAAGDQVIDVYAGMTKGKTKAQILAAAPAIESAMEAKIIALGNKGQRVSRHVATRAQYDKYNVLDIAPNSLSNSALFLKFAKLDPRIVQNKVFGPSNGDPGDHLEIPQP